MLKNFCCLLLLETTNLQQLVETICLYRINSIRRNILVQLQLLRQQFVSATYCIHQINKVTCFNYGCQPSRFRSELRLSDQISGCYLYLLLQAIYVFVPGDNEEHRETQMNFYGNRKQKHTCCSIYVSLVDTHLQIIVIVGIRQQTSTWEKRSDGKFQALQYRMIID